MLGDFDLILHQFPGDIDIYPVADVHLGAVEHAESDWRAFLKRIESEDAYLILDGDLINNSTWNTKFANPFNEKMRPREAKKLMTEYLEPLKHRILAVVGGNHEARTSKETDQDITYDICSKLDIEHLYRENLAVMCLALGQRSNAPTKAKASYNFVITHGAGGGIYTGASVNRDERFGNLIDGLDCLVTAHVHKGFVTNPAKLRIDARNRCVKLESYTVISCVSWLNFGGYAAQKMLLPSMICKPQKLHLSGQWDKKQITTIW